MSSQKRASGVFFQESIKDQLARAPPWNTAGIRSLMQDDADGMKIAFALGRCEHINTPVEDFGLGPDILTNSETFWVQCRPDEPRVVRRNPNPPFPQTMNHRWPTR